MGFVTPDYGTIFWMIISFGIVLVILKKFAWKPILKALKERESSISAALKLAETARNEVKELREKNEQIIAEARKEKDLIMKEARDIKDKIISEAKLQANKEAQKSIENARKVIEAEKAAAIKEMKIQIADLSVLIAEKITRKQLEKTEEQDRLVEEMLNELNLK